MKVKHNFLDLMRDKKMQPRWALPAILVSGIILGAAATAGVLIWVVPQWQQSPVSTPPPSVSHEETQEEVAQGHRINKEWHQFDIAWKENPRKLNEQEALAVLTTGTEGTQKQRIEAAFQALVTEGETSVAVEQEPWHTWAYVGMWEVGDVQSAVTQEGAWKGATVYHVRMSNEFMMGGGYQHLYLLRPQEQAVPSLAVIGAPPENIGIEENEVVRDFLRGMTFLSNATIKNNELPSDLLLENGEWITRDEAVTEWGNDVFRFDGMASLREVTRTKEGLIVYAPRVQDEGGNETGCLYVFAPDGKRITYRSTIARVQMPQGYSSGALRINWDDRYRAAAEEQYIERLYAGCGEYACAAIVPEKDVKAAGGLTRVGETDSGDPIFMPERPQDHPVVKRLYDGWYIPDGNAKPSITEMLQQHPVPVFYWQDAIGRWVEYQTMDIMPMAECGKPVIYLYPEQPADISVRLPSFVTVTVSDPAYPANGWRVAAQPNGQLTSYDNGNTYGSLYWEGTGVTYAPPKEGFVVKGGEVESFLQNVLPQYGLNETETRDFMEFWVPEMIGAPYYRISFLTSAWSAAAPLAISPRPQTTIRLFMDWTPLSEPIRIPEPEIVTPVRHGFTVVEWGGTLWK